MSKHPTTSIFLDKYHPKADNTCAVSIRVTYNSKKRYYRTKYKLSPDNFEKLFAPKPRDSFKTTIAVLRASENKAIQIIDELKDRFTWSLFEKRFVTKTGDSENLIALLEERAKELRAEGRISTAVNYDCTLNSIKKFHTKDKLTLDELTVSYLNKYKKWMLQIGNSNTTTGMYLRNVRYLFNKAIEDGIVPKEIYPFGSKTNKCTIPTGRNIKKALPMTSIASIYHFIPETESQAKAKDFWLFSYLANGINVKDISLLKFKDIDGDSIRFERAKTKRENEDKPVTISIPITSDIKRIINKWGNKSQLSENYIFPILSIDLTAEEIYNKVQLFTSFINKHMKAIAKSLEIQASITTYVARHSFASVLKHSGKASQFEIGEALGHQNPKTTLNYLSSFEDEAKREMAKELTNFSKLKAV